MIDKNFVPLKKAFLQNGWDWNESDDLFKCISVKEKDGFWLYNYNDNVLVDRNHPVLMKCRGIVVNSAGVVFNYPFDRFFNYWEKEAADIDWGSAIIQEKIDGSLCCVWHDGNDWRVSTRGSFYPQELSDVDFEQLFKKHFSKLDDLDKDFCYMFELATRQNMIVTLYKDEGVYLIGARSKQEWGEVDYEILDMLAKRLGVKRPRYFSASDINSCIKLFDGFRNDEEGLVVVDKYFNRVKIKQESYLKLSRIKMLKEQDIFEYVLGRQEIDVEYLEKLPEVKQKIKEVRTEWDSIVLTINGVFLGLKGLSSRKEFALSALKYPFKNVLFALLDGKSVKELSLEWGVVREWCKHEDPC